MTALRLLSITLFSATVLAACATLPQPESSSTPMPQWVTAPPRATAELSYFVGTGAALSSDLPAAENRAIDSLAAKIAAAIRAGVGGGQLSQATRADLQSFEQRLRASAGGSPSSKLEGFDVTSRWVAHHGDRVTVYLLAQYTNSALDAERSRLATLERERTDPVAVAQARGEELLAAGKPYAAAVQFMQAALDAVHTSNRSDEFRANIKKAEAAIAEIRLAIVTDNLESRLDRRLPSPFLLDVNAGGDRNHPVAGARFRITYPVPGAGGSVESASTSAVSDKGGRLSFELPSPRLFGEQSVTVRLEMKSALEPLLHAAGADQRLVASLEKAIASVYAVLHYRTTSDAASIPTGVLVMDLDRGGSPILDDDTASGIENALTQAGFHILAIPSNRSILGIDMPDLVKILRNNFGAKIRRAIVGQARISGFEHADGNYVVKVTGHVEVADLASGKVLFSTDQVKLSRASDASSAINAAFKDLGTSIGNEIKNRLR